MATKGKQEAEITGGLLVQQSGAVYPLVIQSDGIVRIKPLKAKRKAKKSKQVGESK